MLKYLPFPKKYIELLFIVFLIISLSIIFTFPSINNLNNLYIGDGWDNYEYASYQGLAAKFITQVNFPFHFTNFWRFPYGFDFARGFDSYLSVSIGAFLSFIFGFPLSYNLTILILMSLNGLFSYLFFSYLSKSKILGILGMVLYGFSFYVIGKASSHPNLLFIGGFPLMAWSILHLIEKERITSKESVSFSLSLILISLGSALYIFMITIFSFIYLFVSYLFYKEQIKSLFSKIRKNLKTFLIPFLISIIIILLIYSPHLKAIIGNSYNLVNREEILFELSPSIVEFFLPNPYLKLQIAKIVNSGYIPSIERIIFLGWIEIVFFALFFRSSYSRRFKLFMGVLFLIPFLMILGYGKDSTFPFLPYRFLSSIFPFSIIVESGRFVVILYLILSSGIILFLKSIKNNSKLFLVLIILALSILERIPNQFYLADSYKNNSYIKYVQNQNSSAVLDLPISFYYAPYDILSLSYNKPIINGYFHWSADGENEQSFVMKDGLLSRYICSNNDKILQNGLDYSVEEKMDKEMISLLRSYGVSTLVIHKDDKFYFPVCKNIRLRLARLFPSVISLPTTSQNIENQVTSKIINAKPEFKLYFPYSGIFYLDGLYVSSSDLANFTILQNNQPVNFNYSWSSLENYSIELSPKYNITLKVTSGSTVTIRAEDEIGETNFSLWYRYVSDKLNIEVPIKEDFEKIFEDNKAIIYNLN